MLASRRPTGAGSDTCHCQQTSSLPINILPFLQPSRLPSIVLCRHCCPTSTPHSNSSAHTHYLLLSSFWQQFTASYPVPQHNSASPTHIFLHLATLQNYILRFSYVHCLHLPHFCKNSHTPCCIMPGCFIKGRLQGTEMCVRVYVCMYV